VDEFILHVAPVILGASIRLLDQLERGRFTVEVTEAVNSRTVRRLYCAVKNKERR
jgi:hypothetical protein